MLQKLKLEKEILDKYEAVIGLEIHAQLLTSSKVFSSDSTRFGVDPNTQISVITLGHPGVLPKVNGKAIEFAIKMGLACGSRISKLQIFDRKNYFYPDLPKGYQLTQDKTPVCIGGEIHIKTSDGVKRDIPLNRIHLEEDAGKSMHQENGDTLVDLNRAGVALIEIVTEPALHSSHEAGLVLSEVRKIVRYLEICDGNMEEGSLRCDANVSVREKGNRELGRKVEVKNMNSIRNVQKAIDYEIIRQIKEKEKGDDIISETRTFEVSSGRTFGMRTKEELNDYRYFPDPDLSPVIIDDNYLDKIEAQMPELPRQMVERLVEKMGLPEYDAELIAETKEMANYFLSICHSQPNYKIVSNWIMGPVKSYLNERNKGIEEFPIPANKMAQLISLIDSGRISHDTASKVVFPELLVNPDLELEALIKLKHLDKSVGDIEIKSIIDEVLDFYPDKVLAYKKGKKGLLGLFMGEVMKRTKGKANPKEINTLLKEALD